jgi:hypothetical protein
MHRDPSLQRTLHGAAEHTTIKEKKAAAVDALCSIKVTTAYKELHRRRGEGGGGGGRRREARVCERLVTMRTEMRASAATEISREKERTTLFHLQSAFSTLNSCTSGTAPTLFFRMKKIHIGR